MVKSQHEEIIRYRALAQRGKYVLKPEYAHYGVTAQEWMKMRPDQRQQIDDFQKAIFKVSAATFKKATTTYTEVDTPCSSTGVDKEMQQYSKTTYTEIDTPCSRTAVDEEMQQFQSVSRSPWLMILLLCVLISVYLLRILE